MANLLKIRTARPIVELHWGNQDARVRIVHQSNDVMAMPIEMAIEACRAFAEQIRFKYQFDGLMIKLMEWLQHHDGHVAEAYLTVRDSGLLFLVVTKGSHMNDELECALTELDLEIAHDNDYDLIRLGVHAIPSPESQTEGLTESFVSRKMAIRFSNNG